MVKGQYKKLETKSNKELITIIKSRDMSLQKSKNALIQKTAQIRHFRIRIKKISDSLHYLLIHPFSFDNNYLGRKK